MWPPDWCDLQEPAAAQSYQAEPHRRSASASASGGQPVHLLAGAAGLDAEGIAIVDGVAIYREHPVFHGIGAWHEYGQGKDQQFGAFLSTWAFDVVTGPVSSLITLIVAYSGSSRSLNHSRTYDGGFDSVARRAGFDLTSTACAQAALVPARASTATRHEASSRRTFTLRAPRFASARASARRDILEPRASCPRRRAADAAGRSPHFLGRAPRHRPTVWRPRHCA